MTAERPEGQPKTNLFPLSDTTVSLANGYMRAYFKLGLILEPRNITEEVFVMSSSRLKIEIEASTQSRYAFYSLLSSPYHTNFANEIQNTYELDWEARSFYALGLGISGESVSNESKKMKLSLPYVNPDDLDTYKWFRETLVGRNVPMTAEEYEERMKAVAEVLEDRLLRDDPAMSEPVDTMLHADEHETDIVVPNGKCKVAYLLGLMDGYYPFRYISEWGNATAK